jgi:hypothetical protein
MNILVLLMKEEFTVGFSFFLGGFHYIKALPPVKFQQVACVGGL